MNLAEVVRYQAAELINRLDATPFHPDILKRAQNECRMLEGGPVNDWGDRLYDDGQTPLRFANPPRCPGSRIRKPDQIIQPWQFGHAETKATCLWLKGLPQLKPTKLVLPLESRVHRCSPGPNRWKERSRTMRGIADAMAEQWGKRMDIYGIASEEELTNAFLRISDNERLVVKREDWFRRGILWAMEKFTEPIRPIPPPENEHPHIKAAREAGDWDALK